MSSTVIPRTGRSHVAAQKRWSAPQKATGFARLVSTPEQITRDVRGLKLRQRVSVVLGDEIIREELEEVVGNVDFTGQKTNLQCFRTYQDFLIPTWGILGSGDVGMRVIPIADIRGINTMKYSKEERLLRCKLAAVYRLAQTFHWSDGVDNHVLCTARALEDDYYYLTPPQGLLPDEITAGSMVKMDQEGNTVDSGTTNLSINKMGLQVHSSIYEAKSDVMCVMFLTSLAVKAVSVMDYGLLPISHEAAAVGEINYHTPGGIVFDKEEKELFTKKLDGVDKVLVLRNVGAVVIGKSLEETFYNAFLLLKACEHQVHAVLAGVGNLIKIDDEVRQKIFKSVQEGDDINQNKRKMSDVHFEAWMRMLDGRGHKTGYEYTTEVFKHESLPPSKPTKAKSPAKASSFRFNTQGKDRHPVRRSHTTGQRAKIKWLNEPVKSTEYRFEIEPDKEEDVIIKDKEPEKSDKEKVLVKESANSFETEALRESAPQSDVVITKAVESNEDPSGNMVTVTTVEESVEVTKEGSRGALEDSKEELDSEKLSPSTAEGGSDKKKKRKKVKKSRSFKDTMMQKLGMKKEPKPTVEEKEDE